MNSKKSRYTTLKIRSHIVRSHYTEHIVNLNVYYNIYLLSLLVTNDSVGVELGRSSVLFDERNGSRFLNNSR
jgi:hypothetical protein